MSTYIKNIGLEFAKQCITIQKNDGFKHAYYLTAQRIEKLFTNGEQFFGAFTHDNRLVGFASINIDTVRLRIHFFFVDKKYQGSGIGSDLLFHILGIAQEENITNIYTYTEVDSPLEQFLLYKGFEKAGFFKKRFGDKDANILSRYL